MADSTVTLVDNPMAPDVFAGSACGFFNLGGTIMITFEAPHVDHRQNPGPVNRVVIGRLVMPLAGAQGLALGLYDFLKTQGLDPAPVPTDGTAVQ